MDNSANPVTGRPATPGSETPAAIADDIRETRSEMSETIDAISAKLDPSNLVDQAKEMFTSSARDAGSSLLDAAKDSSVLDTIKANPVPAMAVGLSLAWFLSKLGESETDRYRADRYAATGDPMYAPVYGASRQRPQGPGSGTFDVAAYERRTQASGASFGTQASGDGLMDKASDALGTAKDKASDALGTARDTAADLAKDAKSTVADVTGTAKDRASSLASAAGDALPNGDVHQVRRQATGWMERQMESNPLALGAVALAAGALVGLSIPETRTENDLLGDHAETVKQKALSAAEDTATQAQEALSTVADEAKAKAESVAKTAKTTAQKVGDKATTQAKEVADKAAAEAKNTAKAANAEAKTDAASGAQATGSKETTGFKA